MNQRNTGTDRVPGGTRDEARAAAGGRVDHLHFDRQARVWRTHAELDPGLTSDPLLRGALSTGGGAEAA